MVLLEFSTLIKTQRNAYLAVSILAIAIIVMLAYGFYRSDRVMRIYPPLMEATTEIQLSATTAHLWFEEIISGDRHESINSVWQYLDQADWYAQAMLQGAKNQDNTYILLNDEKMQQTVENIVEKLTEFRIISQKRLVAQKTSMAGTDIDQHYDFIFKTLTEHTAELKQKLKEIMARDLRRFRWTQFFLSLSILILLFYIKIIFSHYTSKISNHLSLIQKRDMNLKAEIAKSQQAEHRLKEYQNQLEEKIWARTAELEKINVQLQGEIVKHQKTEQALQKSEARYRAIVEDQTQLICRYALDGRLTFVNSAYCHYFGKPPEDFIGKKFSPLIPQEDLEMVEQKLSTLKPKNPMISLEHRVILKDGKIRWHQCTNRMIMDESENAIEYQCVAIDITQRKQAEEALKKAHHALKILTKCRQVLIHAKDESSLFNEICRVLVHDVGYVLVWIGFAENDERKSVRPVSHCGYDDDYLENITISWADNKFGQGPTGECIRTGKPCFANDILTDPKFAPWRSQALKRGYASSMSIPLKLEEKAIGAINVYSKEVDSYDKETIRLFEDLADDLMYSITMLRKQK